NESSVPRTSRLALYPDLHVRDGSLLVTQPADLESGANVVLTWVVENNGTGAAGAYQDRIQVFRVNADITTTLLTQAFIPGPTTLASGAADTQTFSFRLPEGLAGAGTIRFVVTTDVFNAVREFDAAGIAAENNNQATLERFSTHVPSPDLAVSNVVAP